MVVYLLLAVTGAAAGSITDLLLSNAYRTRPLFGPPSRCTRCRAYTTGAEWIPLLGGLLQPRCRECGSSLLARFAAFTVGGSGLFLLAYLRLDGAPLGILGGLYCLVFLALTFTDLERRLLPDRIVLSAIVLAACTAWMLPGLTITEVAIGGGVAIGLALGLILLSLPFGSNAVGMGDIKVVVLMGFMLGPQALVVGLFIAMLSAGLFAFVLLVARRRKFGDYIPHGPFLALGGVVSLLWGSELWDWYAH